MANPENFLLSLGITDGSERAEIHELVLAYSMTREKFEMAKSQQERIGAVNTSYQEGLVETIRQTIKGFKSTMTMYQVSFYLGVLLIIAALLFAILEKSSLYPILFGTIGTLDLLTFFIAKPPQSLQRSRSEQAKLNATFYSWFINLYNWNSFFVQESNSGNAPGFDVVNKVSEAQLNCTERLMKIISENINTDTK